MLYALDVSRTDIRLDEEGNPRFDGNQYASRSDARLQRSPPASRAEGIRYEDLILEILYLGASRWGMVEPREIAVETNKKK